MSTLTNSFINSNNIFVDVGQNWSTYFLGIEKIFFVTLSILYIIFAVVVVRQVTSLSKEVGGKFNIILTTISFINLGFSFFLVFLTLLVL